MTATLTIRRPDDWHVHLRDGAMLEVVAPYTARMLEVAHDAEHTAYLENSEPPG